MTIPWTYAVTGILVALALAGSVLAAAAEEAKAPAASPSPAAETPKSPPAPAAAEESAALATPADRMSYSIGVEFAKNYKRMGVTLNVDLLLRGMTDEIAGKKLLLDEDALREALMAFQAEARRAQLAAMQQGAEKNQKEGEAFLAENKAKPGVVTTASGLQYKILKAGTGKKPTDADTVECHYRGTLINGTEFDSSYARGQPATFPVSGVIPGWTEALKLMPVGSKWQLFVPAALGYGARGAGGEIGPNATLLFEVELLRVK